MQFLRIALDGFGTFVGSTFSFRPGRLNLIVGRNEAGKSTLMRAIPAILFGLEDRDAFRPWASPESFAGRLDFFVRGTRYTVERDFDRGHAKLGRIHSDQSVTLFEGEDAPGHGKPRPYLDALRTLMPITSAELFLRTTFVAQEQLETSIEHEIKALITGTAGRSFATEIDRLKRQYLALSANSPWSKAQAPKTDKVAEKLSARLAELLERKARIEAALEEGTMLRELLDRHEKDSERLDRESGQLRAARDVAGALCARLDELEDLRRRITELEGEEKRVRGYHETESVLEGRLSTLFPAAEEPPEELKRHWEDLKVCVRNWRQVEKTLAIKQTREEELQARVAEAEEALSTRFADFSNAPDGTPQRVRAVAGLRAELAQVEARRAALRGDIKAVKERLEREFPEFRKLLPEVDPLAPNFPLLLSSLIEKWEARRELSENIAAEEAELGRLSKRGPGFWAAVIGPVAAAAGAFAGHALGNGSLAATAGAGGGLAVAAVAGAFLACQGKSAAKGMAKGKLSGLGKRKEELDAWLAAQGEGLRSLVDQGGSQDLLQRAMAFQEIQGELEVKSGQLEALLDETTDDESGDSVSLPERLRRRLETESAPLGPLADQDPDQVEARFEEYKAQRDDLEKLRNLLDDQRKQRFSELEGIKEEIELHRRKLSPVIEQKASEEVEVLFRRYEEMKRDLDEVRTMIRANRGLAEIEKALAAARSALASRSQEAEALMADYPQFKKIAETPKVAAKTIEHLEAKIGALERASAEKKATIEEMNEQLSVKYASSGEDLDSIHEEIVWVEGRLSEVERTCRALETAVTVLGDSVQEYQETYLERLAERASTIFAALTGGAYTGLNLIEGLVPGVRHAETGAELAPDRLSCGARDQLYLSIRIALAEELAGEIKLPLLLDDPFNNFDDERLLRIREVLAAAGPSHQILLFTHDRRYLAWTKDVIDLDAPGP